MLKRCYNEKHHSFSRYGAIGISVCDEWRESFNAFLKDVGEPPSDRHTLDRIDNANGYKPGNCRWATPKEQGNNRCDNKLITVRGEVLTVTQAAEKYGANIFTVRTRIRRGHSPEVAIFAKAVPPRERRAGLPVAAA